MMSVSTIPQVAVDLPGMEVDERKRAKQYAIS